MSLKITSSTLSLLCLSGLVISTNAGSSAALLSNAFPTFSGLVATHPGAGEVTFHKAIALPVNESGREIPFQLLESGHIVLKAIIDGIEGNFIFDTGAGLTVVTKTFFEKLKHVTPQDGGYTGFRATGERVDLELFLVTGFELGGLHLPEEEISYLDVELGGFDGIISLKPLEEQPFTIDFKRKMIVLESPEDLSGIKDKGGVIPIQLEQSRGRSLTLFSYFKINDQIMLQMALDSGAGKGVFKLNSRYLETLGVDIHDTLVVKRIEKRSNIDPSFVSINHTTRLRKISAVAVPNVATDNFKVQFVEGLIYDGIMWINWLAPLITIDIPGRRIITRQ